ncbi:MAG TPA: hypothetical protein P5340_11425 [Defluviicoccus sp.]|nr:hypothetical protein [Defluviicoccus sp.]
MTALTADRRTAERAGVMLSAPAAASVKVFAGALVMLDSAGNAKPGAAATGCYGAGRAEAAVDNSGGTAGAEMVSIREGVFAYASAGGGDAIGRGDIGKACYIVDDQTVALSNGTGTRSLAGQIADVDSLGVWVRFGGLLRS